MPSLKVLNGLAQGHEINLTGEVFFLGRDPNNHCVLPDRMVSRKHAVIHKIEEDYVLSDLKSLKGTWMEEEKIHEVTLQEGTEFRLGDIRLRFSFASARTVARQKGRWGKDAVWLMIVVALIAGTLWYFYRSVPTTDSEIDRWYQQGIVFWNQHRDYDNAQKAWEHVLELDAEKKTSQAKKAAKLLEMLKKMNSVDSAPPADR